MAPTFSKEFLDTQSNYRVQIHSETCTLHDNNRQTDKYDSLKIFKTGNFVNIYVSVKTQFQQYWHFQQY